MEETHTLRILFLEDVAADTEIAERTLRKEGIAFISKRVETKETFLHSLQNFKPDLIISDYSLPRFDGMQALKMTVEIAPSIPFILLTGTLNEETAVECMKAGATDYVLKDRIIRLPYAVKEALEQKKSRADKEDAERALLESEEIFRRLFEESTDPILLLDDSGFTDCNQATVTILGYSSKHEFLNKKPWVLSPERQPDGRLSSEKAQAMIAKALSQGHNRFEWVHTRADGTEFPVEVMLTSIILKGKQSFYTVWRDITDRKRAEESLLKLKKAVDTSGDAIFLTDKDGIFTYVNPGFTSMYGYTADDVVGKTTPRIIKSGVVEPHVYEAFWKNLTHGQKVTGEFLNKHRDGSFINIESSANPILDEKNNIIGYLGIQRDITERKRAEEALIDSENRYRELFEVNPHAMWVYDLETYRFLAVNETAVSRYGYSRDEFLSMTIKDIRPAEDIPLLEKSVAGTTAGLNDSGIWRHRLKNGRIIRVEIVSHSIEFSDRKAQLVLANDVTKRIQMEMALRESNERFNLIARATNDAVWDWDIAANDTWWNDRFYSLFGFTPGLTKPGLENWSKRIHPDDRDKVLNHLLEAIGGISLGWSSEFHIQLADGSYGYVFDRAFIIRDESGKAIRVIGSMIDMTMYKKAEEQLKESEYRLRTIIEAEPQCVKTVALDGTVLSMNPAGLRMIDAENAGQVIGKSIYEIIDPEYHEAFKTLNQNVFHGEEGTLEFQTIGLKGTRRWVDSHSVPLRDQKGMISAILSVTRDITEKKNVEKAFEESREKYRGLSEASFDAVFISEKGICIEQNNTAELMFGYTDSEAVGRYGTEWIAEKDRDLVMHNMLTGHEEPYEVSALRKDGTTFPALIRARMMHYKERRVRVTSLTDITERKKTEEALIDSEDRYRDLIENSQDLFCTHDLEGNILSVNSAVLRNTGYSKNEILTMNLRQILIPRSRDLFDDYLAKIKTIGRMNGIMFVKSKNGDERTWEFNNSLRTQGVDTPVVRGMARDVTEKKHAEREIRMLANALKSIHESVSITDPDNTILFVNDAFANTYGYTKEELIGKNITIVRSPKNTLDAVSQILPVTLSGGWEGELWNRRKDGSDFLIHLTTSAIVDLHEKIVLLIGVATDITDRKIAELAQQENEAKLKVILESTADGILAVDEQGKVIKANPRFAELWQIPQASLESGDDQTLLSFVLEQLTDPDVFLDKVKKLYGTNDEDMDTLLFKDGRVFERYSAPLSLGNVRLGRVWSFRDITERKKAEAKLLESEEKYKAFFDDDLTGDYISTPEGQLLSCNVPFAKIFGYESVEEIMKSNVISFYPDSKMREMLMKRLIREKRIEYYSAELLRKDGKKVHVIENMIGKFDSKGKLVEIKGYLFDDTSRHNLERQLIQAQKMESLGTLAGGIAHDFNNILAIVLGHISLIRRKFTDNEYIAENADTITKATQRGAGLVKQLLTFARKTDIVLESILLQETINEIKKFIEQTFPRTITIRTECEKNLPPIVADSTQIHQVLLNLCINARDAMSRGGTLSVTAFRIRVQDIQSKIAKAYSAEYIHITVSDTGTGMDEETKGHIFEPFFTTKGRERGTGLGLATVYGIIEAHHGSVDVQTEIGKGTSFHIYFPVQQSFIEHQSAEIDAEEIPGGKETILIVDDEESMKKLLTAIFEEKGYRVLSASDGQEALDTYAEKHAEIDIVLTDMGLPKVSGDEVVAGIKKINGKAKIIVASGYFEKNLKSELLKSGVKDFVQKPYLPDEILQKVREVLDQK